MYVFDVYLMFLAAHLMFVYYYTVLYHTIPYYTILCHTIPYLVKLWGMTETNPLGTAAK